MLNIYDLYDLHQIFVIVRFFPDDEENHEVLSKVIQVLENRQNDHDPNQFRTMLQSINALKDKELYGFVFTENVYTYFPSVLKDEKIYEVLIDACKFLLKAIKEKMKSK
ncbi:MAG: hypothetical protein FWF49_05175 [Oscillospiraceae bacterium]|nr:hypothetical protein [Oscillospiraceae bacterium]